MMGADCQRHFKKEFNELLIELLFAEFKDTVSSFQECISQKQIRSKYCFLSCFEPSNMGSTMLQTALTLIITSLLAWPAAAALSNNTVFVISVDGYRYDFHKIANTPNLNKLRAEGVHAERMIPIYPTKTWPNHQSMMTGLYSESHGIVSNRFWDPVFEELFIIDNNSTEFELRFWNAAEPVWLTNEKIGGRSALFHWPGFKSYKIKPTYYIDNVVYNASRLTGCMERIDKIMSWLDSKEPPNFIALYHDHPDWEGHIYGPNSKEYIEELEDVDRRCIGYCISEMEKRKILNQINLIVVSDHGFLTVTKNRTLLLDNYIDLNSCNITERFPIVHIWPKADKQNEIYDNLTKAPENNKAFKVYLRKDIPAKFHWRKNRRIPPILIQMEPGWFFADKEFVLTKYWYTGAHGYDPQIKDMGTIFIGRGPAFKQNFTVKPFESINVYPLVAHILGIPEKANNASLRRVSHCLLNDPFATPRPTTTVSKPSPSSAVSLEIVILQVQLLILLLSRYIF